MQQNEDCQQELSHRRRRVAATPAGPRLRWPLLAGCVVLILYGTLFPFTGWRVPAELPWPFHTALSRNIPITDIFTNVLLYLPFGGLLVLGRRATALPLVMLAGGLLSLGLETAQVFLPGRVPSLLDIALNVLGASLGAAVVIAMQHAGVQYRPHITARLYHNQAAMVGLAALAAWFAAQLVPFVPSLDIGNLKDGLAPVWHALHGREPVSTWRVGVYIAAVAALTITGASVLRVARPAWGTAAALLTVLPLRVLVVGRQLSPEALIGTVSGVLLGMALWASSRRQAQTAACMLVPVYIVAEALQPGAAGTVTHPFNWLPFRAHITQPVNGLANLADATWPVLALACLCSCLGMRRLWALLPPVALLLLGVEWAQHWVPGRYPDITAVLVGTLAWAVAVTHIGRRGMTS